MQTNSHAVDPALALASRNRYWHFSMAAVGTGGSEAPESGVDGKVQRLLEAEGMHTAMWERIEVNKQIDSGNGEITLFKTAIVVHGLVRWGSKVRGRSLQKGTFGLLPPAVELSPPSPALTDTIRKATSVNAGDQMRSDNNRRIVQAAQSFLEGQRRTALKPHLASDVEPTFLGPFAKYGPKGEVDANRWGASLDEGEAMEDGDGAEGKGNDGDKKVDERLLEIKELIDTGDYDMGDIKEGYYVDYLRHTASFRADIAHKKEAAIQMPGVEYSMLSTWQRECVHLATQTEPDDRSIHWYVDEIGGKVICSRP